MDAKARDISGTSCIILGRCISKLREAVAEAGQVPPCNPIP